MDPDFWKRYRSVEVSERCVASTFLSFRNYLQLGNIKIMSASSPFFFSPLPPPFSFLSRVVSRLIGVQKTRFPCRSGQNGQIFRSHLFKNPGIYCKQLLSDGKKWPNSGWWAASWAFLGHFSPFHANIYPDFRKRYRSVEVSERCVASTFLNLIFPASNVLHAKPQNPGAKHKCNIMFWRKLGITQDVAIIFRLKTLYTWNTVSKISKGKLNKAGECNTWHQCSSNKL